MSRVARVVAPGLLRHVKRAESFPWSSAAGHCGLRNDALLSPEFPPAGAVEDWSAWLEEGEGEEATTRVRRHTHTGRPCGSAKFVEHGENEQATNRIRRHTHTGRPYGSAKFVEHLEGLLDRVLRPLKRGPRPRGKAEEAKTDDNQEIIS